MKKIIYFLSAICLLLLSCASEKEVITKPLSDGIFSGTFSVRYFVDMPWAVGSGEVTIKLQNGRFYSSANPNRIPAGGSGTFSVNNKKITFNDENPWWADFDWGLILNGEYYFEFDGKRLRIWRSNNVGLYEYILERQ